MRSRFLSVVLLVAAACTNDVAAPVSAKDFALAAAVSSGGMTVTSTSPDSATQDTTLDVVINGSGFVLGTTATWALGGVADSAQVRTNSTRYVSSRKLIANITIKPNATIGKWDVVVAASGKGGIGTEAFTIKTKGAPIPDDTPDFYIADDPKFFLNGDAAAPYVEPATSAYSGTTKYSDGVCGVSTVLFDSPSDSRSGDATLGTGSQNKSSRCSYAPRKVRITYAAIGQGGVTGSPSSALRRTSLLVAALHTQTSATGPIHIPVGSSELRPMNLSDDNGTCISLRFRPVLRDGTVTGADQVRVTRVDQSTFLVESLSDEMNATTGETIHHDKAWCERSGQLYHLPLRLIIHNVVPLYP